MVEGGAIRETLGTLLPSLQDEGIEFVLIGGVAMGLHGRVRATMDVDLAIRALDVDKVLGILYERGYRAVIGVRDSDPVFAASPGEASEKIDGAKMGFIRAMRGGEIIDLIFEPGVPFARLIKEARSFEWEGREFRFASARHLLAMKEKSSAAEGRDEVKALSDRADALFLRRLIESKSNE